jgi:hypothetical protein
LDREKSALPERTPDPLGGIRRTTQATEVACDRVEEALFSLAQSVREVAERMAEMRQAREDLGREVDQAESEFAERTRTSHALSHCLSEAAAELALQQGRWDVERAELSSVWVRRESELSERITALEAEQTRFRSEIEDRSVELADRERAHAELDREHLRLSAEFSDTVAALEAKVLELEAVSARALETAKRSEEQQKALSEEQDRFIESVIDEHEAKLAEVGRSRDEALARIEELTRSGEEPPGRALKTSKEASRDNGGHDAQTPDRDDGLDAAALEARVKELEEQLERFQHERELSREVLRRLQSQRDEAHESAARISRQLAAIKGSPEVRGAQTPGDVAGTERSSPPRPAEASPTAALPTTDGSGKAPAQSTTPSPAVHPAGGQPVSGHAAPQAQAKPATPPRPRTQLAAALAASDPTRRKASGPTEPSARPAVEGKLGGGGANPPRPGSQGQGSQGQGRREPEPHRPRAPGSPRPADPQVPAKSLEDRSKKPLST